MIWLLRLAVIAAVVAIAVAAYEGWRGRVFADGDRAGAARVQGQWDEDRAQQQAQALENARLAAAETLRRLNYQQENQRAQDALMARVRADAAASRAAVDSLRLRAATYLDAAGCGGLAGDPAAECVRQAARKIGDVLGQCAARHQQLAADADDARSRGLKCEADYDSLTLRPSPTTKP